MRLGRRNVPDNEYAEGVGDIVDSMPYNSEWAPGGLAGCDLGEVDVNVGVNPGGLSASGGFGWGTLLLIGAGIYVFRKYLK
ncbi:MAG TPA: hypothetical protein VGB07_36200 [Blastocatellia bacterium]